MTSKNLPEAGSTSHERPESVAEKEEFSSGGNRHLILLRGKVGLAIDTALLWLTGYSLMTKQYTYANGAPYQPTLLLYTVGARSGTAHSGPIMSIWYRSFSATSLQSHRGAL